jgi:hypothetical protein
MKTLVKRIPQIKAAIFGVVFMSSGFLSDAAAQVVIYSQDFTGGPSALAGTTSTTGGGTWVGNGIVRLDGITAGAGADSLAFTPQSGFVYNLTATISITSADPWIGVGFLESNATYGFLGSQITPTALRTTGWQIWPPGFNSTNLTTSDDVLVQLDTTGAQWTAAVFQGDTQIGSTYTYATNPTINWVGFVSEGASSGTVSAFELTVVPEPSTWALLAMGLMTILFFRCRRRQAA